MSRKIEEINFKPFGKAIKDARIAKGMSRNELANITGFAPRYIANIENAGQRTSIQTLYTLARLLDVSLDPLFFPDRDVAQTTERRQLNSLLNELTNAELTIIAATATAILKAREVEK